jgi:glutamine---fructose-6-phosphate transaminase (isomerizing)
MSGALMQQEMADQPEVLARLVDSRPATVAAIRGVAPRKLSGIMLLGRGSSDSAALHARYVLELTTGRPVTLGAPSLWTRYEARTDLSGWLVVAISQSGRTPEIVETLRRTAQCGARTVTITNDAASDLASVGDAMVWLAAGQERAVPATKTVTASMLALCHVAAALGELPWEADDERRAAEAVASAIADHTPVVTALERMERRESVHLGRAFTMSVALESALKMKEAVSREASGYAVGDFLHGPVAAVDSSAAVVGYAARGATYADVVDAVRLASSRGATAVMVTDAPPSAVPGDMSWVGCQPDLPEPLSVLPMVVRGQQFALLAARAAGIDPDHPSGLRKVTRTS